MFDYVFVFIDAEPVVGLNGVWKFREGVPIPANDYYTSITVDELRVHQALGLAPILNDNRFVNFVDQVFVRTKSPT